MTETFLLLSDGSTKIRTDQEGTGEHNQKMKLVHGADSTYTDVQLSTPWPVGWGQLNASRGADGMIPVVIFGTATSVGTTWTPINALGANTFRTTASTMRVKAGGNANDTAAGSGTQEVTIYGLSDTFALVNEAVATAGASASSATTQTYRRVYQIRDTGNGTYGGTNAAAVTVEIGAGSEDHAEISTGYGIGHTGLYTIPAAHTGYLTSILAKADTPTQFGLRLMMRESADVVSAPFKPAIVLREWLDIDDIGLEFVSGVYRSFPAMTDVWLEAQAGSGTIDVTAGAGLAVVPGA